MKISDARGASQRRLRRRLALAAVAVGALAGLAMPSNGGDDGHRTSASWTVSAALR